MLEEGAWLISRKTGWAFKTAGKHWCKKCPVSVICTSYVGKNSSDQLLCSMEAIVSTYRTARLTRKQVNKHVEGWQQIKNILIQHLESRVPSVPELVFLAQERHGSARTSPKEATKILRVLEHLCCTQGERAVFFNLEKRRFQGHLIGTFLYLKWAFEKDGDRFLQGPVVIGQGRNGFKLKEGRFTSDTRKKFFKWVVQRNCGCPVPGSIQGQVGRGPEQPQWVKMSLLTDGGLHQMSFTGPSPPKLFYDFWLIRYAVYRNSADNFQGFGKTLVTLSYSFAFLASFEKKLESFQW